MIFQFLQHIHDKFNDSHFFMIWTSYLMCFTLIIILFLNVRKRKIFKNYFGQKSLGQSVLLLETLIRIPYALLCVTFGLRIFCFSPEMCQDIGQSFDPHCHVLTQITVGFYLFDINVLLIIDFLSFFIGGPANKWDSYLHNGISIMCATIVLTHRKAHWIIGSMYLLQCNTLFSSIGYVLYQIGLKEKRIWSVNQFFLKHAFHVRGVVVTVIWYQIIQQWKCLRRALPTGILFVNILGTIAITVYFTPYYGYVMTKELFSSSLSRTHRESKTNEFKNHLS